MRIELLADGISKPKVHISHGDEILVWDVSIFDKSNFAGPFDMYHYNNQFLAKKTAEEQQQIFNIFKSIRIAFDEINEWKQLSKTLQPLIHDLFTYHEINTVKKWILYHSDIQFPTDLKAEYIQSNDKTGSREQTYIISDYQKLIALTFCLRLMIPIWGEFIAQTRRDTGTSFKEYYAFLLLANTDLFASEAMEKLTTYVSYSMPDERSNATVLGGISSEDYPLWILSLVVIRCICTKDISGHQPDFSLIPYIYNHVKERVKRSDTSFDGLVKEKRINENSSDSDGRTSGLEEYKIRQENTPGDVVLVNHAMQDILAATLKIYPDIDLNLFHNAIETAKALETRKIEDPQITLVKWIFKPYISTRGIDMLSKPTMVCALGATQAILWHRQHYVLSALSTAIVANDADYGVSSIESRARIPKQYIEEIQKYYPYTQRTPIRQRNAKPTNLCLQAIDNICDEFSSYNWIVSMDREFLKYVTGSDANRTLVIPHDIRIRVAQLVLDLVNRVNI